jgi:hypothetical protein
MCCACELDDPDPTINDMKAEIRRKYRLLAESIEALVGVGLGGHTWVAYKILVPPVVRDINGLKRQITHMSQWATSDDDDNWLNRKYRQERDEWDKMEGEDQFWSLPESVLEGA